MKIRQRNNEDKENKILIRPRGPPEDNKVTKEPDERMWRTCRSGQGH